jgi:hypothetical protein
MRQTNEPILRRLAKALHDKALHHQYDGFAQGPLPRRWVDLIHYLDEQERERKCGPQTEAELCVRRPRSH